MESVMEKELVGDIVLSSVHKANDCLFYIMNNTKNEEIEKECKRMIGILTANFHVLGLCSKCDSSPK